MKKKQKERGHEQKILEKRGNNKKQLQEMKKIIREINIKKKQEMQKII